MQREEKQLEACTEAMIQRVQDLKSSIAAFIFKLEREYETLHWPTMLDNFALLSGQITTLNRLLKNDKTPPLRNYVFLPLVLAPERDPALEKMTEGRVVAFNHEVVPDYLRTKSGPEVEDKLQHLTGRASQMAVDNVQLQKQITSLNKLTNNILDMINTAREDWETESGRVQQQTSQVADTHALIAASTFGKGLKQLQRGPDQPSNPNSQRPTPQQSAPQPNIHMSKAPNTIKTNIKAGSSNHPYQRP